MSKRILTVWPENDYRFYLQHNDEDMKYGLPDKKKYPMPDRDHVMSAIKFFNYVSPSDEKELARNIIARIREYGIEDINVGENNRFGKYYNSDSYLAHHGIPGMRWGVRRYQNKDGSLTSSGRKHYSAEAKAERKAKKAETKAAKRREKILNDPKLLKKHFNEYSEKEINDALKKFDQMQRLESHTKNRSKAGRIRKAMASTVGTGALIVSGYNTYQALKKITGR